MFKLKPLTILFIGLSLALAVWGVSQLIQKDTPLNARTAQIFTDEERPNDFDITPATIQTAVYRGGRIIISGNGVPNSQAILKHSTHVGQGDGKISSVQVNGAGQWTLSFILGSAEVPLALTVDSTMLSGQTIASDETLFVVSSQEQTQEEQTQQAEQTGADEGPLTLSVLVLLSAPGGQSRVLQAPRGLPSIDGFTLEAIDYDNSGGVIFSGSSDKKGAVVTYLRGRPVVETQVGQNGRWSLISGNTMPLGTYKVGAQLFPEDGSEAIKLTLPFERKKPFSDIENSPKILVTRHEDYIQVARALHGGGYQYTIVYDHNALEINPKK